MTDTNHIPNREELLRLAALDALGLLDQFEAEHYSRSFHHAPAAVQDEILALQATVVSDESFLSSDNPDPSLRERVLARVAMAIEEEAMRLAPIASIGRRAGGAGSEADRAFARSTTRWRAASFAMAACLVVALLLFLDLNRDYKQLAQAALNKDTVDQLKILIGPDFESFISNPNAAPKAMVSVSPTFQGSGAIWVNGQARQAFVLGLGLPEGGTYTLRARRSDDGETFTVATFSSDGFVAGVRVPGIEPERFGVGALAAVTWEVVNQAGVVILTTSV